MKAHVSQQLAERDAELVRLKKENDVLRVVYAKLEGCPYGHFDKERKFCELGLPGCACADDVMAIEFSEYDTRRNAELVRLRADAARLDWLDASCDCATHDGYGADDMWWKLVYNDGNRAEDATIREVIDAARHSSEGTP